MSSLLEESHIVPTPSAHPTAAASSTPPIQSFQLRRNVAGVETELLIQTFDDRILVVVTQNGKVGCLTQASLPAGIPLPLPPSASGSASDEPKPIANGHTTTSILSSLPPPPPGISLTPLLGSPPSQALYELYTSQIATLIWWSLQEVGAMRRHVVVGLALSKFSGGGPGGEDGEDGGMGERERERFGGVVGMVAEWEGPK